MREYERAPRKYELMTILHPEVAEEALPGELDRISGYISAIGAQLIDTLQDSPWGRRRLAYPIRSGGRDVRDGYYTVWHFEVAPTQLTELERELKLNDQVIRYIVLSWEPRQLTAKEIEAAEIAAEDAAAAEYVAAQAAAAAAEAAGEAEAEAGAAVAEAGPEVVAAADSEAAVETDVVIERAADAAEDAVAESGDASAAMGLVTPAADADSDEKPIPAGAVRPDADGVCPAENPIKGNLSSMYYHAPGTRFYDRTIPEYCFDSVESAEAAGFGPTKEEAEKEAETE